MSKSDESAVRADRCALYRHFSQSGELLYVGISISAARRTGEHCKGSPWFQDVARIEIEWFASRGLALDAESVAIASEHPRHNCTPRSYSHLRYLHPPRGPSTITMASVTAPYTDRYQQLLRATTENRLRLDAPHVAL